MSLESSLPLKELRFALSVKVGSVLVHAKELEATLERYCQAVFCVPWDETRFLSLAGSMTLLRYRGQFLGLITQHQTKGFDLQTLTLPGVRRYRFISSNGYIFVNTPKGREAEDGYDVGALRFDEPVKECLVSGGNFFPLSSENTFDAKDSAIAFVVFGHAFVDQKIEYEDDPDKEPGLKSFGLVKRVCICRTSGTSADHNLLRLETVGGAPFDSNGFSGGTVFAITIDAAGHHTAKLAGMVCRGGIGTVFHAVKATVLRKWMDGMIAELRN